jgi:hypothetical protein
MQCNISRQSLQNQAPTEGAGLSSAVPEAAMLHCRRESIPVPVHRNGGDESLQKPFIRWHQEKFFFEKKHLTKM